MNVHQVYHSLVNMKLGSLVTHVRGMHEEFFRFDISV